MRISASVQRCFDCYRTRCSWWCRSWRSHRGRGNRSWDKTRLPTGTWITGFCATSKVEGAEDPCTMSLNGHGTGYTYTGSNSRALQGEACGTEEACGGCNGTWCLYPKEVIY